MLGRPLWPNHHVGLSILFLFPRIQSLLRAPVCLSVLAPSLVLGVSTTIILTCPETSTLLGTAPSAFIAFDRHGWH